MWDYQKFYVKDLEKSREGINEILKNCIIEEAIIYLFWGGFYICFQCEGSKFHPLNGTPNILNEIEMKPYSLRDMKDLSDGCERIEVEIGKKLGRSNKELFDKVKIHKFRNYSKIIDDLQKSGFIAVEKSTCFLATDPRKFMLFEKVVDIIPELKKEINIMYEVDCLGSSLFVDLTKTIIELWDIVSELEKL